MYVMFTKRAAPKELRKYIRRAVGDVLVEDVKEADAEINGKERSPGMYGYVLKDEGRAVGFKLLAEVTETFEVPDSLFDAVVNYRWPDGGCPADADRVLFAFTGCTKAELKAVRHQRQQERERAWKAQELLADLELYAAAGWRL